MSTQIVRVQNNRLPAILRTVDLTWERNVGYCPAQVGDKGSPPGATFDQSGSKRRSDMDEKQVKESFSFYKYAMPEVWSEQQKQRGKQNLHMGSVGGLNIGVQVV